MALANPLELSEKKMTAEAFWQLASNRENIELVEGVLLSMSPPGGEHGDVTSEIILILRGFVKQHQLGKVLTESGFRLKANPDTVRSPDVSFLATANLPPDGLPAGFITGPPDLAIEVVSPNDTASIIQDKVQDYLSAGSQLVWLVYPQQRIVIVYYPDGTAKTLHEQDTLAGETVVPGFSCRVADFFG
jgi:Uma2 family endonuclease